MSRARKRRARARRRSRRNRRRISRSRRPHPTLRPGRSAAGCNACQTCMDGEGVCRPDPSKNGLQCGGCHTCRDGACNAPDDTLCPEGQRCSPSTGICCPACQSDGSCCPVGSICIDPGPFSANFCCDTELFDFCGGNGDGTFKTCCARDTHRCLNDQCVPKGECPDGMKLCPGGDEPFCAPERLRLLWQQLLQHPPGLLRRRQGALLRERALRGWRGAAPRAGRVDLRQRVLQSLGEVCCGGSKCCSPYSAVSMASAARSGCAATLGRSPASARTEEEFCCSVVPSNHNLGGYACPRGNVDEQEFRTAPRAASAVPPATTTTRTAKPVASTSSGSASSSAASPRPRAASPDQVDKRYRWGNDPCRSATTDEGEC